MKFVFVLGSPFCGSTAVGNMLNSHPNIFHAGEVDRLKYFSRYHGSNSYLTIEGCTLCRLAHSVADCPIWNDYPDFTPSSPNQIVTAYEELTGRACKPIILDSSKNADWLATLWEGQLRPCSAIILSRNPFAFAYSHFKATGQPFWQGVEYWRNIYNHCLRVCTSKSIPIILMRHHDLLNNQNVFFQNLSDFLGISGGIDYENFTRYECHALGGNAGAFVKYPKFHLDSYMEIERRENREPTEEELAEKIQQPSILNQRKDDNWLRYLSLNDIRGGINIPGVAEVMTLLGYDPTEIFRQKLEWEEVQSL